MPTFHLSSRLEKDRLAIVIIFLSFFALSSLAAPPPVQAAGDSLESSGATTVIPKSHREVLSTLKMTTIPSKAYYVGDGLVEIEPSKQTNTLQLLSYFAKTKVSEVVRLLPVDKAAQALELEGYKHSVAFTTNWPLNGNGDVRAAIAKITINSEYDPKREFDAYTKADQLIDFGTQVRSWFKFVHDKPWWIVVKDLTKRDPATGQPRRATLISILESPSVHLEMSKETCIRLVKEAIELTRMRVRHYVEKHQMLHTHADPMNAYFRFDSTRTPFTVTDPEITDWIGWEDWPTTKGYTNTRLSQVDRYMEAAFNKIRCDKYQNDPRAQPLPATKP